MIRWRQSVGDRVIAGERLVVGSIVRKLYRRLTAERRRLRRKIAAALERHVGEGYREALHRGLRVRHCKTRGESGREKYFRCNRHGFSPLAMSRRMRKCALIDPRLRKLSQGQPERSIDRLAKAFSFGFPLMVGAPCGGRAPRVTSELRGHASRATTCSSLAKKFPQPILAPR